MTKKQDDISSIDNFHFNKAMILECFDAWTFTKGERYFRNGAVESWEAKKNAINGKVKGSYLPYYKTKLRIESGRLVGSCSCPVGFDCKHCVALALQWLENKNNRNGESTTPDMGELNVIGENNILEEEHGHSKEASKTQEIPLELKQNSIQDVDSYLHLFPRTDLENLVIFFMKEYTNTQEITIFTPQFISTSWNSHFSQLDDDFNKRKKSSSSPLMILEQIKDDKARVRCIKNWFEGYMDLIGQIKDECRVRGMLMDDGEELYEYYKNEEYDRLEEELHEESNKRYDSSYGHWDYDDYDYLEPYEDFDLDTSTLKSYIENFFNWLIAPIQDICDYSVYLHQYNLINHQDYLIKKRIQWLKDLKLPTEEFGIDPERFSVLMDLKSIIATKLSFRTHFSKKRDQLNYLYSVFIHNPSERNSGITWAQFNRMHLTEQEIQYFIEKILKNFENKPTWGKFDLLKRLILTHQPEFINTLLKVSIDSLYKTKDAGYIIKEIFSILETHPVDMTLAIESGIKQTTLKVPTKPHFNSVSLYRKTIDWLVNYYSQKKMFVHAFNQLIDLANIRPKMFEFRDYKTLKEMLPSLTDQFVSKYEAVITLIIQKGTKELSFQLLLEQEKYDKACDRINTLSSSIHSYSHHYITQWGAITRLILYVSLISDKNKENMIKILKAQIADWVSHSSRNRPDTSIAEAISQIRTIYLALKTKDGEMLWKKWFKSFSNKHWRLRNLRSALNKKGIEMKKR